MEGSRIYQDIVKPKILIVDDRQENIYALEKLLKKLDADIFTAQSGNEALAQVIQRRFAVVLLDVQMPEMDGFEVAKLMRENEDTENTPVIFLTATNKEKEYVFEGYDKGAVDFLFKPIEPKILTSKIDIFLRLEKQKLKLEKLAQEKDILIEKLEKAARTDPLTGLANRRSMEEKMANERVRSVRSSAAFSLILSDIDHFKKINDSYGHDAGDNVLVQISKTLTHCVREQDTVCRWGGEEFLILLPGTDLNGGIVLSEKIRCSVANETIVSNQVHIPVTMSFGVSVFEDRDSKIENCIKIADLNLYKAKESGRNRVMPM